MLRYRRFVLLIMFITNVLCANTINFTSIIRKNIVFNTKMPCIYTEKDYKIEEKHIKSMCSLEHIFPRSYLQKKDYSDMHNVVRTINELNVMRSNYKYVHEKDDDCNWKNLSFDNYVNHKTRLFVPNNISRGFISRSILYMAKEYNYNISKIIDKEVLIKWFYEHPPCVEEIYHNQVVKELQNKNNMFISCYNKKSKSIHRFLQKL